MGNLHLQVRYDPRIDSFDEDHRKIEAVIDPRKVQNARYEEFNTQMRLKEVLNLDHNIHRAYELRLGDSERSSLLGLLSGSKSVTSSAFSTIEYNHRELATFAGVLGQQAIAACTVE